MSHPYYESPNRALSHGATRYMSYLCKNMSKLQLTKRLLSILQLLRMRHKQYSSGDHWHLFVKICIGEQKWGQFFHIWSHLSQSATSRPLFATQLCHFWARHTLLCASMQFWLSAWSMGAPPSSSNYMSHKSWSKVAVSMLTFSLLAYFAGIEKAWNGLNATAALREAIVQKIPFFYEILS